MKINPRTVSAKGGFSTIILIPGLFFPCDRRQGLFINYLCFSYIAKVEIIFENSKFFLFD